MVDVAGNNTTKAVLETEGPTGTYSGRIETIGDHDWIRVTLTQGITYNIFLSLQDVGTPEGDSELNLRDATGALVPGGNDDDDGAGLNSFLSYIPPATGTYYIEVFKHGDNARGAYGVLMTFSPATNVFLDFTHDTPTPGAGERIAGGAGDDLIDLTTTGLGLDALGEQGNDRLVGNAVANLLSGGLGNDQLLGGQGDDTMFGDADDDFLAGEGGADKLLGGDGMDDLDGGADNDRLIGGGDIDRLSGGTGGDFFIFKSVTDSGRGADRDQILDFSHAEGDKIDLSIIDANTHRGGNQKFAFIGAKAFGDHEGQLRFKGGVLAGDVNGDGRADFEIHVNAASLLKADFTL
ncbi:MAG TPA: M10 family metallopeptidase C-terminal domain-containing protein [Methyloceanibacter sp.]|jgi:Ca2+-binding RTX toxin-like protein